MGVFLLGKLKKDSIHCVTRGRLLAGVVVLFIVLLGGCGDKELAQRRAFIDFLQVQVVAMPGINLSSLTPQQKKLFGEYNKDYAVLTDFHHKMEIELNSSLVPVFTSMNALTSVNALLQQRDDLKKMADSSARWLAEFKALQAQADIQHSGLKQPQDLKKVYDQAYNKVVSQPSATAEKIFTLLPQVLNIIVVKADFIKGQGKNVTISGNTLQFATQAELDKYNAIQKQLVPLNAQLMALSRDIHKAAD